MPPTRSRFVTACQQLLALGVVLAALAPATNVVSLDVVREQPAGRAGEAGALRLEPRPVSLPTRARSGDGARPRAGAAPVRAAVLRNDADLRAVILPTGPSAGPIATTIDAAASDLLLSAGDWDGDGLADVITRQLDGTLLLHLATDRDRTQRGFAAPVLLGGGFEELDVLEPVGDLTGDGLPDLLGRDGDRTASVYPGAGAGPLGAAYDVTEPPG